jgi:hypothetical protein
LEDLSLKDVGMFYGYLVYFTSIWYNLWPFGIICGHLVYFSRFGVFGPRKSGNPVDEVSTRLKRVLLAMCKNWSSPRKKQSLQNILDAALVLLKKFLKRKVANAIK